MIKILISLVVGVALMFIGANTSLAQEGTGWSSGPAPVVVPVPLISTTTIPSEGTEATVVSIADLQDRIGNVEHWNLYLVVASSLAIILSTFAIIRMRDRRKD